MGIGNMPGAGATEKRLFRFMPFAVKGQSGGGGNQSIHQGQDVVVQRAGDVDTMCDAVRACGVAALRR
jgi:hypothetical protein